VQAHSAAAPPRFPAHSAGIVWQLACTLDPPSGKATPPSKTEQYCVAPSHSTLVGPHCSGGLPASAAMQIDVQTGPSEVPTAVQAHAPPTHVASPTLVLHWPTKPQHPGFGVEQPPVSLPELDPVPDEVPVFPEEPTQMSSHSGPTAGGPPGQVHEPRSQVACSVMLKHPVESSSQHPGFVPVHDPFAELDPELVPDVDVDPPDPASEVRVAPPHPAMNGTTGRRTAKARKRSEEAMVKTSCVWEGAALTDALGSGCVPGARIMQLRPRSRSFTLPRYDTSV